jgi:drug/metabolite transporter superfamily protein YnfA
MTVKLFLLAVLFVISGGVAFSEYFKNNKFISLLATAVAIIATFYLFQDICDDLKQPSSAKVS